MASVSSFEAFGIVTPATLPSQIYITGTDLARWIGFYDSLLQGRIQDFFFKVGLSKNSQGSGSANYLHTFCFPEII